MGALSFPPPPHNRQSWPWRGTPESLPSTMLDGTLWPRITIVTPSFNQAQYIEETLRSVLLQGYPNLEYLVIDGGSTDGSAEIIERYEPWLAYHVSERDRGQAHAINKGFARATGDLIGWLNSDDLLLPGALVRLAEAHRVSPLSILAGGLELFTNEDAVFRSVHPRAITLGNMVQIWQEQTMEWGQPATYIPRALAERVGFVDEQLRFVFDRDWLCRLLTVAQVEYIDSVLARFRVHSSSKTVAESRRWLPEQVIVTERYMHLVEGLDPRYARAELEMSAALASLSISRLMNRPAAIAHIAAAAVQCPRVLCRPRNLALCAATVTPRSVMRLARRFYRADLGGW